MKKILFAITGLGGGGAERVVSVWASQLAEQGYEVAILTFAKKENEYEVCEKVKRLTVTQNIKEYLSLSYIKRYKLMRKIVKEFSPDVVISLLQRMQIWMSFVTIGIDVKRIDTVRISPWHSNNGKIVDWLWKRCFKTGDLTILQSEDQKSFFSKKVQKKCVVVPNPLNELCENVGKTEFSSSIKKFTSAGRLAKQKTILCLLKRLQRRAKRTLILL